MWQPVTMAACHDSKIFLSAQWLRPDQSPLWPTGHAFKVIFSPLWTASHLSTLDFLCHFITQSFCSIRPLCSSSESAFIFITPHEQTLQTHYLLPCLDRFDYNLQDNTGTRCSVLGAAGTADLCWRQPPRQHADVVRGKGTDWKERAQPS